MSLAQQPACPVASIILKHGPGIPIPTKPAMTRRDSPHGRRHLNELDGIRGIAVLLVMTFHLGMRQFAGKNPIDFFIGSGWTGVDLFFVLSGFLITSILLDTRRQQHYFRNFYVRRALRILPLYYFAVAGFLLVVLPLAHRVHLLHLVRPEYTAFYWLHLSNLSSAFGFMATSPIGHFWSLSVEEQFYFVWPLLVFALDSLPLLAACLLLALASPVLRMLPAMQAMQASYPEFLYRLTPFRLESLCYGAVLAILAMYALRAEPARRLLQLVPGVATATGAILFGVASYVAGGPEYQTPSMSGYGYTGSALFYMGLVGWAVTHTGSEQLPARMLRSRFLRFFGKYSYAMYVFHVPVSDCVKPAVAYLIKNQWAVAPIDLVLGIGITTVLARLSWVLLEQPFLKLKERFAPYVRQPVFPAPAAEAGQGQVPTHS